MSQQYVPFVGTTMVRQYSNPYPVAAGSSPPQGPGLRDLLGTPRKPTVAECQQFAETLGLPIGLIIGFPPRPPGSATRYFSTFDACPVVGIAPNQVTLFEIPAGSNQWWMCVFSVVLARSFINEHKNCYLVKAWPDRSNEKA
jgi:hypothetical protein